MASTAAAASRQSEFEQAVAYSLHLWPSLALAVQNNWGGPDSADKRDWFAGAIVDLFPDLPPLESDHPSADSKPQPKNGNPPQQRKTQDCVEDADNEGPDVYDVEEVLLQVMLDEFEVNVDDDSSFEVAENIVRAREQLAAGKFEEVNRLRERFNALKGKAGKVGDMFKKAEDQDQDTDWEEEEEGDDSVSEDVDMGEAPALVAAPREKPAPEVDEDGFTKVTRKKR